MKLLHVVGARPNFPKLAPVHRAAEKAGITQLVVHTGQHYDDALSGAFFRDLGVRTPDVNLDVGSSSHAQQTAEIMKRIEAILAAERPDWLVVYGDVNSTIAAALVAVKLGIRVAHVEAGLRSGDRTMPEEINRIVTDRLATLLLTPSLDANAALRAEGEPEEQIVFVGNVMVDSLLHSLERARATRCRDRLGASGRHVVVTLHRPSNVDVEDRLRQLASALATISATHDVIFPMHPRTKSRVGSAGLSLDGVQVIEPLGYLEMIDIVEGAHAVVTDSGGVQEETTALGVPCFTVRETTERPVTITEGTNRLVRDLVTLPHLVCGATRPSVVRRPAGWDGQAGRRVVEALISRSVNGA